MSYRVVLVNMPFAALRAPSIALTQLSSRLRTEVGERVVVEVVYANHDLARHLGVATYDLIAEDINYHVTGVGDWLFRQCAFPHLADNREEYLQRYFPRRDERTTRFVTTILGLRDALPQLLDRIIAEHDLLTANLVGFTSMFAQTVPSAALARRLKDQAPAVVTVMGGANCDTPMGAEIARHVPAIDLVFSGPGLVSFPRFVQAAVEGRASTAAATIPGILTRDTGPESGARAVGEELEINDLVELDYDSFLDSLHAHFPKDGLEPKLFFETSRGCWWGERSHCTFCGLNGLSMGYRAMSPANATRMLQSLFRYADRCKDFASVDNILPVNYPREVFANLRTPPGTGMFYEIKADIKEEDLRLLAEAGVTALQPGIESLNTSTLKLMRKGTSAFQNIRFLKACLTYGIEVLWNLLIGFPLEQEDVYAKYYDDISWLTHLPPPTGVSPVRFDRFSPYFTEAERYGLQLRPFDSYPLTYPLPEESLQQLAYYFKDEGPGEYVAAYAGWYHRLNQRVSQWRARWPGGPRRWLGGWENTDVVERPPDLRLVGDGDDWRVLDSRQGGAPVWHSLSADAAALLQHLVQVRREKDLAAALPEVPASRLADALTYLRERHLVFVEGERLMSLCLGHAEPVETRLRTLPVVSRR